MAVTARCNRSDLIRRRCCPPFVAAIASFAMGCGTDSPLATCDVVAYSQRGTLVARDSAGLSLAGFLSLRDSLGTFEGDFGTPDGSSAPVENAVRVFVFTADSVDLLMLPNEMRLRGSCVNGVYEGKFSLPQPPFSDIQGTFSLRQ